jgi:nucleoside-diphosphate-sugar epimerase
MAEKSAFVTGGTGFLGLNLVEQLTAQGWRVSALHRPSSDLRFISRLPVQLVQGDILDGDALARAIPEGVSAIFHLAADTSVWSRHKQRQMQINVEGTRNVASAALAAGAGRLVYTSTWMTYGLEQGDISEDSPQLGGQSWINYSRTKFLAEEEVRAARREGLDAVILNPAHIMGRYDSHGWARLIIDLRKHWLPGVPPGSGSFAHAQEGVKAHIAAAERDRGEQNYLLGGANASFVEVFRTISEVTGWPVPPHAIPAWLFRLSGRINALWADLSGSEPLITPEAAEIVVARARVVSDRAQRKLGYQGSPLHTIIKDCCDWLAAEGKI